MIEVQSLSKHYGPLVAVDQLSFQVQPGEVLGFLGPNGAGKSTTMKMLTGFLAPSSGTASVMGHDIRRESLAAREVIGYLPEGAPAWGEMTVRELLNFVAAVRGLSGEAARAAVDGSMRRLQLNEVAHQVIDTLSKGFKRRVGLAQAILHDPRVLILDEPTDGLDPNQKQEVRRLIRDMAEDKIIIISTHILEEVDVVCNRAMIIAHGRLLADDTPDGLRGRSVYHNAVTLSLPEVEPAASKLSALPEARRVELKRRELTVFPRPGADLFRAVTRLVEQEQWPVTSLRLENGRLDEVFRTITADEPAEVRP